MLLSYCRLFSPDVSRPHTLVLQDYVCGLGKYHSRSIEVYDMEIELSMFDLNGGNDFVDPVLTITSVADSLMPGTDTSELIWEKNRGFWIAESIVVTYGGSNVSGYTTFIVDSIQHDTHFIPLMDIQMTAFKLGNNIPVRGHWEHEWNPREKYLERPKEIK